MKKVLIVIIFLVFLAGAGFGVGRYIEKRNEKRLMELSENHPRGEEYYGKIKEAEGKLSVKEISDDERFEMHAQIAFYAHSLGDEERAVVEYKKCIEIKPKDEIIWNNIAFSYRELKNYEKAESSFRKLIEISPFRVSTYRNLADLYRYYMEDKKDQAEVVIAEGLEKNPEHPDLLSYMAVYFQEQGKNDLAIQYYERLLKVYPENVAAQQELNKLKTGKK